MRQVFALICICGSARSLRYTQPEAELKLLLERLKLSLPPQSPPKITAAQAATATPL